MNPNPPENDRLKTPVKQANRLRGLRPGDHGQGFKPGQSGNPGGRPKGLAELVRQKTLDGVLLVSIMHEIATGKLKVNGRPASHRDRMAAIEWLADRGFGSNPEVALTVNTGDVVETTKQPEELTVPELRARLAKMRETPLP